MNPLFHTDSYKHTHGDMYFPNTTQIYSHCTPRSNKYLKRTIPDIDDKYVVFGVQYVIKKLYSLWDEEFFSVDQEVALSPIKDYIQPHFMWSDETAEAIIDKFNSLYNLGYLPIEIKSLPEGSRIDINTPILTITNTHKDFAWLTNFLESYILSEIYMPVTVATVCDYVNRNTKKYYDTASDIPPDFAQHCFSYRGHQNTDVSAVVGMAYALFNKGSDTIAALPLINKYYSQPDCSIFSIAATEHSVSTMQINYFLTLLPSFKYKTLNEIRSKLESSGIEDYYLDNALDILDTDISDSELAELLGILRIMSLYSNVPLAYVADSLDFWAVIKNLKYIKQSILSRPETAPFIIRPDSGDPVKVVLGNKEADKNSTEYVGLIQTLLDTFGYTTNSKGYKVLTPQIRAVYGDGINIERMNTIYKGLVEDIKVSPENICLALGAYLLGNITRDSLGFATKASFVVIDDVQINCNKEPKTDTSKKSFKGRLAVTYDSYLRKYVTKENVTSYFEDYFSLLKEQPSLTFDQVKNNLELDLLFSK